MKSYVLLFFAAVLAMAVVLTLGTPVLAQTDPLLSWNDVPTKQGV